MAHKLQISMTIEPLFAESVKSFFKGILQEGDCVRGIPTQVRLTAENLGEKEFPGGKLEITYRFRDGAWSEVAPADIVAIPPEGTQTIFEHIMVPLVEGSASIDVKITANDGQSVEGYQARPDKPIRTNGWTTVFYVVNREYAIILMELAKMRELLSKRLGGQR